MELYRYLIDDFLIVYCRFLRANDYTTKIENLGRKKQGKREYLNNKLTRDLTKQLNALFDSTVEIPRIRVGKKQTVATLINEESQLLAKFLRKEKLKWIPKIVDIP